MSTLSVSEVRENFSQAIATSALEAVFVEKHGQTAAVIISPERYQQLMDALEEIEDATAVAAVRAEVGPYKSAAEVFKELGYK